MHLITPTDPEKPHPEPEPGESTPKPAPDAPLSFVPRDGDGGPSQQQMRFRTSRYGELDAHELIHLLDSIEDERARSRFRESIYISLFIWIAIAWVVLYGPRYLWHAPKLVTPFEVLKQRELTQLNMPSLHAPPPSVPRPQPKVDNRTLEHLRSMEPPPPSAPAETPKVAPAPAPPLTSAAPPAPAPALPLPNAPQPTPRATPPVVAEAPTPQPNSKPGFNSNNSAQSSVQDAIRNAARNPGGGGYGARGNGASPLNMGGAEILSDTQGVNFNPYLRRLLADIYRNWLPLIPEEAKPPLSKQGETLVRFTILPDGRIGGMWLDGSTHDDAINRSAWGSITSEGQFPPLPSQFHGPNLELRIHYYVNKQPE
ncbi:MAG TPA: TonB C-terminal domain-containing protein [Acidobacteriaceae bacterium]|nr:TonB C-terminal domain-containing protein [Acidobacteriaceae bacterium]